VADTSSLSQEHRDLLSSLLDQARAMFSLPDEVRLALLVRTPWLEDGYLVHGNADGHDLRQVLERLYPEAFALSSPSLCTLPARERLDRLVSAMEDALLPDDLSELELEKLLEATWLIRAARHSVLGREARSRKGAQP
jgi:hypothetical protein